MDMTRIDVAAVAVARTRGTAGLDVAIDAAAAAERPERRFLARSWFAAAAGKAPRTLIVEQDSRVLLALPTVAIAPGLRAVPGAYWPFRSAPAARDADSGRLAAALATPAALATLGSAWRLGPVYADDPVLAAARASAAWTVLERRIATGFMLDLPAPDVAAPWPRPSTLKKNRFHEKHLALDGALGWRFAHGADWTPALFDTLAGIEARSWQAASTDAKFLNVAQRRFWAALARDPAQAARMRAAILSVGGDPVAFAFDLDVGTTKYAIANSYDEALGRHSPGKCLSYRMLADAAQRGIRRVDWGAGDSGYKRTIGAAPGAELVDCLILRGPAGRLIARAAGPMWRRSGNVADT